MAGIKLGSRAYVLNILCLLWFFIKLLELELILFWILFKMFRLSDIIIPLLFLFWSSSFYSLLWLSDLILNYFWIYLFSLAKLFCNIRFLSNIIWFWITSLLPSLIELFCKLIFSLLLMHLGGFLDNLFLSIVSTGYPIIGAIVIDYSLIRLIFYLKFLDKDGWFWIDSKITVPGDLIGLS